MAVELRRTLCTTVGQSDGASEWRRETNGGAEGDGVGTVVANRRLDGEESAGDGAARNVEREREISRGGGDGRGEKKEREREHHPGNGHVRKRDTRVAPKTSRKSRGGLRRP